MTFKEIQNSIEKVVRKKRMKHILGVVEAAEELALLYGVDVEKARYAALLHDCCKEYPVEEQRRLAAEDFARRGVEVDEELLSYDALLHGLAGAVEAVDVYGIDDPEILEAVRVHTTGKVGMSPLDKIIFIADYIEVGRDFPGVNKLRKLAKQDLDVALLASYDATILHLMELEMPIYSQMMLGRNDSLSAVKRGKLHEQ